MKGKVKTKEENGKIKQGREEKVTNKKMGSRKTRCETQQFNVVGLEFIQKLEITFIKIYTLLWNLFLHSVDYILIQKSTYCGEIREK